MCDTDTKKSMRRDIFLIAFGAVLGGAISILTAWFLECSQKSRERENTVTVLRHSVDQELDLCRQSQKAIADFEQMPSDVKMWPGSFDILHAPSLYPETLSRVAVLEPELVKAVVRFDFALRQCQQYRDLTRLQLETGSATTNDVFKAYTLGLSTVLQKGERLLAVIDKEYPDSKDN